MDWKTKNTSNFYDTTTKGINKSISRMLTKTTNINKKMHGLSNLDRTAIEARASKCALLWRISKAFSNKNRFTRTAVIEPIFCKVILKDLFFIRRER